VHPGLVRGLVVAEAHPGSDPDGLGADAVRAWLARWPVPFPTREAAVSFFGGPSLYASAWADGLETRADGLWPRFEPEILTRTLREGVEEDHWADWERIRCPTLVVGAGAGFFEPSDLQAMADRVPDGRFAEVPGAKHDLHLDRPVRWREVLTVFLETLGPER
jgi:pimeloyl-ACP methyl ester carboxylesterase